MPNVIFRIIFLVIAVFVYNTVKAEDWPTYQHDNQRSGVTCESLNLPLNEQWRYISRHAPQPAWPSPAKTDYWHQEANLKPRVIFDRACHVVAVGNEIYFASSANDKVYCLDASTGQERWAFFTGGPVRLAPTVFEGNVYVGSDDGKVYCLDRSDGNPVWEFRAADNDRLIPGNERIISVHPVRTGVLVEDGIAYFCSGMFPNEGVYMAALNANDGSKVWITSPPNLSPQGYLLASAAKLYVPTGRTTPVVFNRKDGERIGTFQGNGGTFALLSKDELIYGGGDLGELEIRKPDSKDQIASFNGLQMIVNGEISYLRSDGEISAINRIKYHNSFKNWKKITEKRRELTNKLWDLREERELADEKSIAEIDKRIDKIVEQIASVEQELNELESGGLVWKCKTEPTYSMILAGEVLFVGGDGKINAYNAATGKLQWSGEVNGRAYGLSVANGRLFVSTDQGTIHCFSTDNSQRTQFVRPSCEKNPYPKDKLAKVYASAAKQIIKETGIKKGYCLVIGCGEGRLAYELLKRTDLKIIGIDDNAERVLAARNALDKAGLYGDRVSVHLGSLTNLPFTKYFANLIVSDQALITGNVPTPADEVFRVLKPYGGVAYIGTKKDMEQSVKSWVEKASEPGWEIVDKKGLWAVNHRGEIPKSGEWTHLYADASNTACSMDPLRAPVQIQWFGRPGPRKIINRHSRPMSSLFKDGRLFIPADNRIITIDAYNGTPLWEREVPNSRVLGALKDCGQMVVTDKYIYIAVDDECRAMDVVTGKPELTYKMPQLISGEKREWGYLANVGEQIFGSGKKIGASFYKLGRFNSFQLEEDFRDMILSDYLFSVNRHNGKELWTYRNGVVFNNTITIGDGYIYFVESRNPKAVSDKDGRLRVDVFCESKTFVVKLDMRSGKKIWEKWFKFPFQQIMYLSYADNILLVTGSYNKGRHVHYGLFAFNTETGEKEWENSFQGGNNRWNTHTSKATINGSHGEQWQHPVIVGETIILPPHDFNLYTGKMGSYELTRGGHGCGGLSASAAYLYARGGNPRMYEINDGRESGTPLTKVNRPGCWINIIPAGGLVSIPESSSGCTCDYPIQTSFVFVPKY